MKKDVAKFVRNCLVSTSKSSQKKDGGNITTLEYTEVEVGKYSHGLHSRTTQNTKGLYGNLGDCRQIDNVGTLPTRKSNIYSR